MTSQTPTCTRQHTVVTGASTGIGRATALRLAAAGQHVYAGVRKPADGERLAAAARGGELTPVLLDVTEAAQIEAAADEVAGHAGPAGLDGLVNNAGVGFACPAELIQLDTFRNLLEVNLTGQLAVTQAFLPLLRQARGRIVVISTIGVRFAPPFASALDAAKAALTAPRPRTMYLSGRYARRLATLSLLPAPVLDAAKRKIFGLPAPGSLTA